MRAVHSIDGLRIRHRRPVRPVVGFTAFAIACAGYAAYACAALIRVGALDHPERLVAGLSVLAAFWLAALKKPFAVTYLLLAILPLFGNHPGGRYMELINLPLA